jgi:hypothetical protein
VAHMVAPAAPVAVASQGLDREPDLKRAADLLWARIPTPRRPPPTPQKSWRTLSAGRHLALKVAWFDGYRKWPAGARFEVQAPTSAGVRLKPLLTGPASDATLSAVEPIPWTHPDWRPLFEPVRRGRAKKA